MALSSNLTYKQSGSAASLIFYIWSLPYFCRNAWYWLLFSKMGNFGIMIPSQNTGPTHSNFFKFGLFKSLFTLYFIIQSWNYRNSSLLCSINLHILSLSSAFCSTNVRAIPLVILAYHSSFLSWAVLFLPYIESTTFDRVVLVP